MVKKKILKQQLNEKDKQIKKLEEITKKYKKEAIANKAEAEANKSQLEKQVIINKEQEEQIKKYEEELGIESEEGKVTTIIGRLSKASHYLFDTEDTKIFHKAAPYLRKSIKLDQQKKVRLDNGYQKKEILVFLCTPRDGKTVIRLNRPREKERIKQELSIENALLMEYPNAMMANAVYKIYELITQDKKNNPQIEIPNLCEKKQAEEFLLEKVVPTSDLTPDGLFSLFHLIEKRDFPEHIKKAIIGPLIKKQLRDIAYLRTKNYQFDKRLIIDSSHGKKMLDVYDEAKISLTLEENRKIKEIGELIDERAFYNFVDSASWNSISHKYLVDNYLVKKVLSPDFILDHKELEELVNKHVYRIDLDKMVRMTFPSDDAIHTLEWPVPILTLRERTEYEQYFVEKLSEHGEDIEHYWDFRALEGFYRHIRMWFFYRRNPENYPDPGDSYKQHHLDMSFYSLYIHTFEREPPQKEAINTDLKKGLELMMHSNCRPQAIEYPINYAK
ncbi:hypothetical protein KY348_03465 [Candidatus Woesearchaeota archaeon]|nr:hypothetical protein [Candidatus Woesearchaeota archaeon]